MPRVVAALIARDNIEALAQKVNDLAFPSSPHWAPMTTIIIRQMLDIRCWMLDDN
jgi:hypothetical protein